MAERLQKVLARCGIASRRKAEILMLEGAVTVNGKLATELGIKVDAEKDKIKVNGKLIFTEVDPIYAVLYKPRGVISALSDPEERPHIGTLIKGIRERVVPIGRLDFNSEGLILLTNDGTLASKIQKSKSIPKVYSVKVKGHPTSEELAFLKKGIFTDKGVIRVNSTQLAQTLKNKTWLDLVVTEGASLDIKETLNRRGIMVDRIIRSAIGHITIRDLKPGTYKLLKKRDFEKLVSVI